MAEPPVASADNPTNANAAISFWCDMANTFHRGIASRRSPTASADQVGNALASTRIALT
jgi:hypothetical protein